MKTILKILFLLSVVLTGCSNPENTTSETEENTSAVPVRVIELAYSPISRKVSYTAHLQPYREVHMVPAQPGRIDRILVEAGNRVSQGQLLVEMDKTQLQQAEVQLQNLQTDYQRLQSLREVGSVAAQQYDQLKTQFEIARTNVEFLQQNTRLTAPFAGTVSGKYYENGEMFSGTPNTTTGKAAIISLIQTNRLKATLNVAERFYPSIRQGMEVELTSDLYPEETFKGTVSVIYPEISPATRTFRVELTVANAGEKLVPGMFSRANIQLEQVQAFVVPALAVMRLQGSNERYVFLEKNGKAQRVVVEIGDRYDDRLEVISDEIRPGDRLIIAGQARLVQGNDVAVQQ